MGHYRIGGRENKQGDFYYLGDDLVGDYARIIPLLNALETAFALPKTTWNSTFGSPSTLKYPHVAVTVPTVGNTDLATAINDRRVRIGAPVFPFAAFPTSAQLGTQAEQMGVSLRHPLEAFQAIGRGATGQSSVQTKKKKRMNFSPTGQPPNDPTWTTDFNGPWANHSSGSASTFSFRIEANLDFTAPGFNRYFGYIRVDVIDSQSIPSGGGSSLVLEPFEQANPTKIIQIGGISGAPPPSEYGTPSDATGSEAGPGPSFALIDVSIPLVWKSSNTEPTQLSDLQSGSNNLNGRYKWLFPQSLYYPEFGLTEDPFTGTFYYRGGAEYAGGAVVWNTSASSVTWILWTEPVLPSNWPNDEYTAP